MPNNPIVAEADRLFELHTGKNVACTRTYMCPCFRCQLDEFTIDYDRATVADVRWLEEQMMSVRDALLPVVIGVIERGHCVGRAEAYGGKRGVRKTMLKDAVSIAKNCVDRVNNALNAYDDKANATWAEFMSKSRGDKDE